MIEKSILMLKSEASNRRILNQINVRINKREEILDFLDQNLKQIREINNI